VGLLAAITNGSDAFIAFTIMMIAIFVTLLLVISR
jgi:type III secretory pathway component EscS